jgi:hypothetical protein
MTAPLRFIDDYSVEDIVRALSSIRLSDKATTLVQAIASAPNRAMSRTELARTIGSESVNSCNTVFGTFARNLASALDPSLADVWKSGAATGGDWVMFINRGPRRWTAPTPGEKDSWVFVMRENLARALDRVAIAPYRELDAEALEILRRTYGDDREPTVLSIADPLAEIAEVQEELSALSETERETVILARIGQGLFRESLIEAWDGKCAVTGCGFLPALVASHIKPWVAATNAERLDPQNGLLLVGTLDRLFDGGFITFGDDGRIVISPLIPKTDYSLLHIDDEMSLRHVPEGSTPFLAVHREHFFLNGKPAV